MPAFAVRGRRSRTFFCTAYIRPHEMDISRAPDGESSLPARIVRVNRTGAAVKIGLVTQESSTPLDVQLDQGRYDELSIAVNDTVYVMPRRVRVFVGEEGSQNGVRNSSGITH